KFSKLPIPPNTLGSAFLDLSHLVRPTGEGTTLKITEELTDSRSPTAPGKARGNIKLRVLYKSLEGCGEGAERDEYGFLTSSSASLSDAGFSEWHRQYHSAAAARQAAAWEEYARAKWLRPSNEESLGYGGIPTAHRVFMWLRMSRAEATRLKYPPRHYLQLLEESDDFSAAVRLQIAKDLGRTFPTHPLYGGEGRSDAGKQALGRVLYALARHCPTVGYCQSMNFVCGFLLLLGDEPEVFWLMDAVVQQLLPNYFSSDMLAIRVDQLVLASLVASALPMLHRHFQGLGFDLGIVSTQWFLGLFIGYLPTETVLRLFDALFFRGSSVLFVVALGVLHLNCAELLRLPSMDVVFLHLKGHLRVGHDVDAIMKHGKSLLQPFLGQLDSLRRQYTQRLADSSRLRDLARLEKETRFARHELELLYRRFSNCVVRDVPPELRRSRSSLSSSSSDVYSSPLTRSDSSSERVSSPPPISASPSPSPSLSLSSNSSSSSLKRGDSIELQFEDLAVSPSKLDEDHPLFLIETAPKVQRGLDEDRFRVLLQGILKLPCDVIDRLFFLYARDGCCNFSQFVLMMEVFCRGSLDDKLSLWFRIFDSRSASLLYPDDLASLLSLLSELLPADRQPILPSSSSSSSSSSQQLPYPNFLTLLNDPCMGISKDLIIKLLSLPPSFFTSPLPISTDIDDPSSWIQIDA
ncbi:MAG: TBC domain-containing protein, partial [archaeon]|nr:TBC domain-containing protein [archaeon]